jgi:diaminohydroxyphosphoribosylaminopyrimidine deaminase/5-amino-6-(5-phosphoribosylamino)uracil reductase
MAIKDAEANGYDASKLEGATIYVTLEPCHHVGRTPPCDQRIIDSKFARVVVAVEDPDPRVRGQGIAALRAAGIAVEVGVCMEEAKQSLRPYLHQRQTKRPFVVAKVALSIDGKIGCVDGTSQWITGEDARADAHVLRAQSQAIIVGSETALKDKPRLNVRLDGHFAVQNGVLKPLRVVFDSRGRVVDGTLILIIAPPRLMFKFFCLTDGFSSNQVRFLTAMSDRH